jgi:hypothetical protein
MRREDGACTKKSHFFTHFSAEGLKNLAQPSQQEKGYPPFAGGLILSQQERDMANIGIFLAVIREKPAKSPN